MKDVWYSPAGSYRVNSAFLTVPSVLLGRYIQKGLWGGFDRSAYTLSRYSPFSRTHEPYTFYPSYKRFKRI